MSKPAKFMKQRAAINYEQRWCEAADRSFADGDQDKATEERRLALGARAVNLRSLLVTNNNLNLFADLIGHDDPNTIKPIHQQLFRHELRRPAPTTQRTDELLVFRGWKDGNEYDVRAGQAKLGFEAAETDNGYQVDLTVMARQVLASSLWFEPDEGTSLLGAHMSALPDRVESEITTPPPDFFEVVTIGNFKNMLAHRLHRSPRQETSPMARLVSEMPPGFMSWETLLDDIDQNSPDRSI